MHNPTANELEDRLFDLETQLEAKRLEAQDLANIASAITSILNIESVLAAAIDMGIRQVGGEVGAVVLVEQGEPVVKISWGVDSELLQSLKYDDKRSLIEYILSNQKTVCENDCRFLGKTGVSIRNAMIAPIISKGAAIGAIVVFNRADGGEFSDDDIVRLEMIAKFTAIAIDNANLFRQSLEKQRLEQELNLARQVQETLLPGTIDIDGLRIEATYITARQVGGDYYDLIPLSGRRLFFLIGDVTSKGAPAALLMTSVYSIVRSFVTRGRLTEITDLMGHLNDILCRDIIKDHEMFITLFMAYLDLDAGVLEFCNGGHPPPFYFRASTGEILRLKVGGPLVGQFSGTAYRSSRINVASGDRIFCYTDGLIEAARHDGALFGLARLEEFFRNGQSMDAPGFARTVKAEIDRFSSGADRDSLDDYTTLIIDVLSLATASRTYELTYGSRLENLNRMYEDLKGICERHSLTDTVVNPLQVAISEAMTNAIVHAHAGDSSKIIRITVDVNDERVEIKIADEGAGMALDTSVDFDPVGMPDDESGRGLGLIQRLMDEVYFDTRPGGGMTVRMVKRITETEINGGQHGDNLLETR